MHLSATGTGPNADPDHLLGSWPVEQLQLVALEGTKQNLGVID